MQPKHSAIVAGLTLALSFGAVAAPATAMAEEPTPGVASDATDIDKGLYTQQSFSGVLRSVQGVSFVSVTDEMKYFTKYESHGNYNQGFSYGDGYNALGYYQFDRRWSLIPFMKQVYNYDSAKYGMLKDAIDRGSEISNGNNPMYANGQLTELGRIAQEAFLGAYDTDPAEFSALQDAYAYNSYYAVTESWLKNALGIDISGRADCVKGMVWSITNMCGTGGCQDFFRWANLSNDMTDREFVTALSNSVVENVARKYSSQPQYHEGWKNRYKNELKDCLVYIAEDEAAAEETPSEPEPEPAPEPAPRPNKVPAAPAGPAGPAGPTVETDSDADNGGETGTPSTGAGNNGAGNGGVTSGGTEPAGGTGDSESGSAGGSASGSTGGSVSGSTDNGSSNGSADAGEGTGSDSGSTEGSDADNSSTENKSFVGEQLGSFIGSSMTAGINGDSSSNENATGETSEFRTGGDAGASTDTGAKQSDTDARKVEDKNVTTTTTTTITTTTTKASGGNMPKTGDLIVMASLASASLATLGATSIVSGKHKLDQQKKAAGEDGSEE